MANQTSFKRAARVKRQGRVRPQSPAWRNSVVIMSYDAAIRAGSQAVPLRIDRNGVWHYRHDPITRPRVLRLFARALRREGPGRFTLAAPCERVPVEVEDVPFIGVDLICESEADHQRLRVRTNIDEEVEVGREHPLRFVRDDKTQGMIPYVLLGGALEARLSRSAAFDLASLAVRETYGGVAHYGVWSGGVFFPICPVASAAPKNGRGD
jgi:hypothetical protein